MRGSRVKALRKLYFDRYGEAPPKSQWKAVAGGYEVEPSKWRIWKDMYKKGALDGL